MSQSIRGVLEYYLEGYKHIVVLTKIFLNDVSCLNTTKRTNWRKTFIRSFTQLEELENSTMS